MKASKENCREAKMRLAKVAFYLAESGAHSNRLSPDDVRFISEFLEAAERKLPKEESFARDMKRDAGRK